MCHKSCKKNARIGQDKEPPLEDNLKYLLTHLMWSRVLFTNIHFLYTFGPKVYIVFLGSNSPERNILKGFEKNSHTYPQHNLRI